MNGEIAQKVALACHANAVLSGRRVGSFFPANSTCQFCEWIRFAELRRSWFGRPQETQMAATPDEWFRSLQNERVRQVLITRNGNDDPKFSDRMTAGFVGGGGTWALLAQRPDGTYERWLARWELGNREAEDRRIWRVTYGRVGRVENVTRHGSGADAADAAVARLRQALVAILAFAKEQNCGFVDFFAKAIECLNGAARHGYHRDLAPDGFLPEHAQRLLDACQSAWVFGGMGSWNDMSFEGATQDRYARVSDDLFASLTDSIVVATNAAAPGK